ncbi:MAG: serine hydrolase [Desulfobaccales bacterium]
MKVFAAMVLAVLGVAALGLNPGEAGAPRLPLCVAGPEWRPLSERGDERLQAGLELALKRHAAWRGLLDSGKMAVGLVDLANPTAPRLAQVNGTTMMYAASLPKLMVLLAAFQGFEDGSLKETAEIHRDLIEMIRRSSNPAASQMIGRIGLKKIEALSRDRRYGFYDPQQAGGIWLGGTYSRGGEENPEPMTGLSFTATAYQLCRFYYRLAYGRLINPERSGQMLKILAFPDLPGKFLARLAGTVPPNRLYRKSGEVRGFHGDSVLVWDKGWRRYILVGLIEDEGGEQILRELVPVAERVLKDSPAGRPGRAGEKAYDN